MCHTHHWGMGLIFEKLSSKLPGTTSSSKAERKANVSLKNEPKRECLSASGLI